MSKRTNVNGSAPQAPTFNEKFPIGSPERDVVMARMEAVTGIDFLTVCRRFDCEMTALKEAEAAAKREAAAAKRK